MTRATDVQGNKQPDSVPFKWKGYLVSQPVPHPVLNQYQGGIVSQPVPHPVLVTLDSPQ